MDLEKLDYKDLQGLPEATKLEVIKLLEERKKYHKYRKVEKFEPYPFQKKFFAASAKYKRRFLCAANRVGKSYSEAIEMSYHLTGLYPDWWEGHRFKGPILAWAVGITGDSTRKVMQKELFGTEMAKDLEELGTGSIPRHCLDFDNLERDGNIIKVAKIKHFNRFGELDGHSMLEFRSTQQGEHVLINIQVSAD